MPVATHIQTHATACNYSALPIGPHDAHKPRHARATDKQTYIWEQVDVMETNGVVALLDGQ